jgi:polyisoprenoid-binding protein YceI
MNWGTGTGLAQGKSNESVNYSIDARSSQFRVHAFASGLISAVAHSPKFEIREWVGEAVATPKHLQSGSLRVTVNPAGLELVDEVRESERREIYRVMNNEVLEASRYPEIVFDGRWSVHDNPGKDVYLVKAEGSLRLHGITNAHAFDARVTIGPDNFRAHGEFMVFQRDYGINIASIAGSTLKLRDELKFSFFVVGRMSR